MKRIASYLSSVYLLCSISFAAESQTHQPDSLEIAPSQLALGEPAPAPPSTAPATTAPPQSVPNPLERGEPKDLPEDPVPPAPMDSTGAAPAPDAHGVVTDAGTAPVYVPACPPVNSCEDDCWLFSDEPLLQNFRNQELWCGVKYSIGGELRHRYMDERNRLRPMGTLARDTYQLWRFAPWLEVGNEDLKGYVQAIDAPIFGEDLPKLPIDENRWDLLQYYVDGKLAELDGGDIRGQYGRIFLSYGDQHLISPLAWANTYRNFEGGKVYFKGKDWDIDGFVARPLNGAASAATYRPQSFDHADQSVLFSGIYATYKPAPWGKIDLYWLWNDESAPTAVRQDGSRHTIGSRVWGKEEEKCGKKVIRTYTWDVQGGWQFGEDDFGALVDQQVSAGFVAANSGVTLNQATWSPNISGVFWWGSGDNNPAGGKNTTVNTLYPLGHAYWGLIDNFNGANLLDYSVQTSVKPHEKVTLAAHWHWFDKAAAQDYIYNIAGAPLGDTTTSDLNIGNELDLLATYQANKNLQFQAGYFWFWYGDAVNTQPVLARKDAQQFYFMTTWNF